MKKRAVPRTFFCMFIVLVSPNAFRFQVVMDSAERKVTAFLQQVNTIHNRKVPELFLAVLLSLLADNSLLQVEMRKQQKDRARAEHTKKIAISQRGLEE